MSEGKPRPRPVPVQSINLPGLGASAPRPGQVLPGAGPTGPALQVPNTAQAVRAVDKDGALTGMIPVVGKAQAVSAACLLYTSPSPRDAHESRMPSSA